MLEGYVDVVADIVMPTNDLDGIGGKRGGIGVVQTYPCGTTFGGKTFEEVSQTAATVEVEAIIGGVLRDDDELLRTLCN